MERIISEDAVSIRMARAPKVRVTVIKIVSAPLALNVVTTTACGILTLQKQLGEEGTIAALVGILKLNSITYLDPFICS